MGWFDNQIKERQEKDNRQLWKAYKNLAGVVGRSEADAFAYDSESEAALASICRYFRLETKKIPKHIEDLNEQIDYVMGPYGVMRRRIRLKGNWWKDSFGPLLVEKKEGGVLALIPVKPGCYYYEDTEKNQKIPVTKETAQYFMEEAVCFYRPLPQKPLSRKELFLFLWDTVSQADKIYLMIAGISVMLLGMITPAAVSVLLDIVVPSGQRIMIYSVALLLIGTAVSKFLFSVTKSLMRKRIEQQMDLILESAVFARILNLPVGFFKKYSSGDLAEREIALGALAPVFCEVILGTGLTALFSLGYMFQILVIAPGLFIPSLFVIFLQILVSFLGIRVQTKVTGQKLEAGAGVQGIVFELFSGIQKIKLTGSEKRAFAQWGNKYQKEAELNYNPPFLLRIQKALAPAISLLGSGILYWFAWRNQMQVTDYVAFQTAFAMTNGAVLSLSGMAGMFAAMKPILDIAEPILQAQPETGQEKESIKNISGNIELNNVSFRYTEDGPWILDNLSLKIKKGQYVAIVGKTGCGKSTLMRILMGFERPLTGVVYYDRINLEKIDEKSLRRQIGVVLQNGKLFSGDIFANIAISAPKLTLKEAWEAAEMAGIADDIRHMPMGMNTILSEGAGGISGGQKQRLMIARAVALKPKVLMFDEATSALDNITQKQVSDSLMKMKNTRIVIAHRLSTIRECDRIIVLDKGKIIEDGTYEELMEKGGFFSELVERQQVQLS